MGPFCRLRPAAYGSILLNLVQMRNELPIGVRVAGGGRASDSRRTGESTFSCTVVRHVRGFTFSMVSDSKTQPRFSDMQA